MLNIVSLLFCAEGGISPGDSGFSRGGGSNGFPLVLDMEGIGSPTNTGPTFGRHEKKGAIMDQTATIEVQSGSDRSVVDKGMTGGLTPPDFKLEVFSEHSPHYVRLMYGDEDSGSGDEDSVGHHSSVSEDDALTKQGAGTFPDFRIFCHQKL